MSYIVVALDVDLVTEHHRRYFAGTVEKFLPHITILPRMSFRLRQSEEGFFRRIESLSRGLIPSAEPPLIDLAGPVQVNNSLLWYECTPGCRGFRDLLGLHRHAISLVPFNSVHIFEQFTKQNYRPHLTVFWNGRLREVDLPQLVSVRPRAISLYQYRGDPKFHSVRRREILSLDY